MIREQLDPKLIREFILAGKAMVTIENRQKGTHKTLSFMKSTHGDIWFTSIRGDKDKETRLPGFETKKNWLYCGILVVDKGRVVFKLTEKSKIPRQSETWRAIDWLVRNIDCLGQYQGKVAFYHEGRCGRCGRELSDPTSIKLGIGPECRKKLGR